MPQNIKSLLVVLLLSFPIFLIAEKAFAELISPQKLRARRNTWLFAAGLPFITPNIWVYFAIVTPIIAYQSKNEESKLPLFSLLFLACIPLNVEIPGFAGIRYLFELSYYRILILILLIPEVLRNAAEPAKITKKITPIDALVISYPILLMTLYFPVNSFTNNIRNAFILTLDIIIPYLAFARTQTTTKTQLETLLMFALGICVLAPISIVEISKGWPIFNSVQSVWDQFDPLMRYLMREGFFRAQTTAGHSLIMGYVAMVALASCTMSEATPMARPYKTGFYILLTAALLASFARGAWLGAIVATFVYILLTPNRGRILIRTLLIAVTIIGIGLLTPFSDKIISVLPYIGTSEQENIDYRNNLYIYAIAILKDYPLFGHPYFLSFMEEAKNGDGLIDLVNIYINVALQSGTVGLCIFSASLAIPAIGLFNLIRSTQNINDTDKAIARTLIACLAGIIFTISTLSNIRAIPYIYYMIIGISVSILRATPRRHIVPDKLTPTI